MSSKLRAAASFKSRMRGGMGTERSYLNGAIYGDYGIGKTYFAGTMYREVAKLTRESFADWNLPNELEVIPTILFANAEKGALGIPEDCEDVVVQPLYQYKDFSRLYDFLKLHCKYKALKDYKSLLALQAQYFKIAPEENDALLIFEGVAVDSLTEVQKFCLYQLTGLSQDSKLEEEPEYMQMRQWGTALEMILLMVRNFRDLPIHKMFVIQQTEDTDERKRMFYRPALQGQAKLSILGFFDFVMYYAMQIKEDQTLRRGFLLPVGQFKAKHRFQRFTGSYLDNPTFSTLLEAQNGTLSKNSQK